MTYHNHHAVIHRHDRHSNGEFVDEYYLNPGEGVLFYKHKLPEKGDKDTIFRKAEKAFKEGSMEVFAVLHEELGLLLSPSMYHRESNVAYIDGKKKKEKRKATLESSDKKVKYVGHLHG